MADTATDRITFIQDNRALASVVAQLESAPCIALDTEFLRDHTYFPMLCLLQLATDNQQLIIDPLADIDLKPLEKVLRSPEIVKIVHAGSQDLEILYQVFNFPTSPVFDTQIAAQLLGLPQQIGLMALVKHYTGINLPKSDSYSEWARRPLSPTQLQYAIDDVYYLPGIYRRMHAELEASGRLHWLDAEMSALSDLKRFQQDPDKLWQRLKGTSNLSRRQLAVLRELAIWRDSCAAERDLPRKWLMSDEQLVDISRRMPADVEGLNQTRGLRDKLPQKWRDGLLAAVRAGKELPESELPKRDRKRITALADYSSVLSLMQALVHLRARENHISTNMLASQEELLDLARGRHEDISLLQGWRRELIGLELLKLLDGSLYLSLDQGVLRVTDSAQLS